MAFILPDGPTGEVAKRFGAYYTSLPVAEFLTRWAIRTPEDRVLDPSFGGGVFLYAAAQRLKELGGKPQEQVFGVELDAEVHARTSQILEASSSVRKGNLIHSDFFDVDANTFGSLETEGASLQAVSGINVLNNDVSSALEAVVGNPPFIRYQRFTGEGRKKALEKAAAEGVHLSKLTSSWAPFLVHSVALLKAGGRIGMVIPMELGHAAYARPVLEHLTRRFERVTFITFKRKLFSDLSQDVLLLLAENKGSFKARFDLLDLEDAKALAGLKIPAEAAETLEASRLLVGGSRLLEAWIPRTARELYRELCDSAQTQRLGQVADVGIGYVTGHNNYFHLSARQVRELKIPKNFLRPAVRRSRALPGLRLTRQDWQKAGEPAAGHLFYVNGAKELPDSVLRYIKKGEASGVHLAYKCRVREPWYSVPHVHQPDAFLTYMNGEFPRLVANAAGVVAPNTLHVLRLRPGYGVDGEGLAALWQTSLTRLSAELEGHAMGGGMLKLEPSEADRVVLAKPNLNGELEALAHDLDALLRSGRPKEALERADAALLQKGLGLSKRDCALLSEVASELRERRYKR